MTQDPTYLGTVQDVRGAAVSVALDSITISGLCFIDGHGYRIGQVGSFVRIPMGYLDLLGVVAQVGAGAVPERLAQEQPYGNRWLSVQLVGEADRRSGFRRGLSQHPTIGDTVHLVTEHDLQRVYGRPDAPEFVRVGHISSVDSIPALLDINKLVTRHCAVVGATGSGKSTTVAGLLANMTAPDRYPSARVIVVDLHGEYATALGDRATVFRVTPDLTRGERPLHIPYWAMTFDELLSVSMGTLDDPSRGAVLERIVELKLQALVAQPRVGVTQDNLTVDSPVPFSIHKLWFDLHRLVNATHSVAGGQSRSTEALFLGANGKPEQPGDAMKVMPPKYQPHTQAAGGTKIFLSSSPLNIRRPLEGLASRLRDPRFDFLFRPGPWCPDEQGKTQEDLGGLLEQWIGGPTPVCILDVSGIPIGVTTELVGVVLRILYDALFWSRFIAEGGRQRPLLVVLEEAHAYLGQGDKGFAAATTRRVVKEGRKYGIGAMIVSQRPAEIDPTILSQCGTVVAMRLSNPSDRAQVASTVGDSFEGMLGVLPVLRTGEAIILGEAVHLPMRAVVDPPAKGRRPDSADPIVAGGDGTGGWDEPRQGGDYEAVVRTWRAQDPRATKANP